MQGYIGQNTSTGAWGAPLGVSPVQGDVTHIYSVGRSVTAVQLIQKVNGQFEMFSKVNGQASTFV